MTAQLLGQAGQMVLEHLLLGVHAAAGAEGGPDLVALRDQNAQIQRGLHQTGDLGTHGLDAVGQAAEQAQHLAGGGLVHGDGPGGGHLHRHGQGRVGGAVLVLEDGLHLSGGLFSGGGITDHKLGLRRHGNGVVLEAAADADHPQLCLPGHGTQHPAQQDVGVGPSLVDLRAGVAAGEALHLHGHGGAVKGGPGHRQDAGGGVAAGTADGKDALRLGVQIEHGAALQRRYVHGGGAQQADLLVHGEHRLQPGVGDVVGVQNGQGHGHGDAVVAAQRGALGVDVVAIHGQIQALTAHILAAAGLLLTHHVQVPLEDHRFGGLIARGGLLDDDDVVALVLMILQAPLFGKGHAPVADGLGVPGPVGNGAHLLEKPEHTAGFQMLQNAHS